MCKSRRRRACALTPQDIDVSFLHAQSERQRALLHFHQYDSALIRLLLSIMGTENLIHVLLSTVISNLSK